MLHRLGRRLRSATVVVVIVLGSVVAVAAPANAAVWSFAEDFENNPYATWSFEYPDASSHGNFEPTNGIARSGRRYANIYRFTTGWNSVDRTLRLPATIFAGTRRCSAQAWIMGWTGTRFNIEVINPADWGYVKLGQFTSEVDATWRPHSIAWGGGPRDVVLRFVVVSEDGGFARIKVDDVTVTCVTWP